MRRRVPRACAVPGCPHLVYDPNQIYCVIHAAQKEMEERRSRREHGTDAQYGYRWQQISKRYLRKHPYCAMCGKPAEVVHHIKPRAEGGSDAPGNLMALCRACHTALHNQQGNTRVYGYGGKGD